MKSLRQPFFLLAAAVLAALAAGGCNGGSASQAATPNKPAANATASTDPITAVPDKDRYRVTADTTGFFRYSPLQPGGSDYDLKKNARLTVLKHGRGYCQIKTADNQVGYVGTEDIAQLAPSEIAQEDSATLQAAEAAAGAQSAPASSAPITTVSGKRSTAVVGSSVTIPSDAGRNERLPEPDAKPKATPTPH